MLMVGANAGIVGMTKEHLGLALALSVPVFVVVTKIDMCPENVLQETLKLLVRILRYDIVVNCNRAYCSLCLKLRSMLRGWFLTQVPRLQEVSGHGEDGGRRRARRHQVCIREALPHLSGWLENIF